jgi:hypothetical protein
MYPEANPIRSSRTFLTVSNLEAVGATIANYVNANDFTVQFNNSSFTNVQANAGDGTIVKMYPQLCSLDLNYFNISAVFGNNKLRFTSPLIVNSPVVITIPDGIYNIINLISVLQTQLNTYVNFVGEDATNYTIWFDTTALSPPTFTVNGQINLFYKCYGAPTVGDITVDFVDALATPPYNSRKLFGSSSNTIVIPAPALPVANKFGSYIFPYAADLLTYNIIRVHANLARRTYAMSGGAVKALNQTDIFFEMFLTSDNGTGTTVVFSPNDPFAFEQVVDSNFDTLRIQLRDVYGNLIQLAPTAEFHLTLGITREIPEQSNAQKIQQLASFQHFNSIA